MTKEQRQQKRLDDKEDKKIMRSWLEFTDRMQKKGAFVPHSLDYTNRNPIFTKRNFKNFKQ